MEMGKSDTEASLEDMLKPQSSWLIYGLWVYVCLYIHLFNFQLTEHKPKLDRRDKTEFMVKDYRS